MAKKKHTSQGAATVSGNKQVHYGGNPDSYKTKSPVWSFRRLDKGHHKWAFRDEEPVYSRIICKLSDFEGMTWSDIESASGGKSQGNGSNSHFVSVSHIIRDAQKRLMECHMEDIDELFSLRLTGRERLWGIVDAGIFQIIWYDRNHEIYDSNQ